jgi:glycosyltransferase involved in cell wall biosynthesis
MEEKCAEEKQKKIPHILHQIWNDRNIPLDMVTLQRTWQEKHPGWEYYLWTDSDKRELLRKHYAWFLPIYDGYDHLIKRADVITYFILHHYGGVYVDLDFECLHPIEPLLEGKQLVFGQEPKEHLTLKRVVDRGFDKILAHGFIASIPGHPFWEYVFKQLVGYHKAIGPLDATGNFMLTRSYDSFPGNQGISLESAELLYPIHSQQIWSDLAPEERERIAKTAYAVHHWFGTWCAPRDTAQKQEIYISCLIKSELSNSSWIQEERLLALLYQSETLPLISCLMVTRNRAGLAQFAVRAFQNQTYPEKELVILDDGQDDALHRWLEEIDDSRIVYHRLPDEGKTLGELRNVVVQKASGEYIAQWDDDDLSDPDRLAIQMAAIQIFKAEACFLERHQIWWPAGRRMALSTRRIWESSFLCSREKLPVYPALRQGEDTSVIEQIFTKERIALLDFPELYTYVYHGANTFQAAHWEKHWQEATASFEGGLYDVKIKELSERLKLDLSTWLQDRPTFDAPVKPVNSAVPSSSGDTEATKAETVSEERVPRPKVLILCPVMNMARFLPRFWENLQLLEYPRDLVSIAFLESDSLDDTPRLIQEKLPALRNDFRRVDLFRRNFSYPLFGSYLDPAFLKFRKSTLARIRNYLLSKALMDEDWVLWADVRIASWPEDLIEQLLALSKEIVAPNCLTLGNKQPFDLDTFRLQPGADQLDWSPYEVEGILFPPKDFGRFYLNDLRSFNSVTLDSVGGSLLLVRADLHREGLIFPPIPYKQNIEAGGLAALARDMGYRCWGLPNLEIFHPSDHFDEFTGDPV